jgi:hypothetical protein
VSRAGAKVTLAAGTRFEASSPAEVASYWLCLTSFNVVGPVCGTSFRFYLASSTNVLMSGRMNTPRSHLYLQWPEGGISGGRSDRDEGDDNPKRGAQIQVTGIDLLARVPGGTGLRHSQQRRPSQLHHASAIATEARHDGTGRTREYLESGHVLARMAHGCTGLSIRDGRDEIHPIGRSDVRCSGCTAAGDPAVRQRALVPLAEVPAPGSNRGHARQGGPDLPRSDRPHRGPAAMSKVMEDLARLPGSTGIARIVVTPPEDRRWTSPRPSG